MRLLLALCLVAAPVWAQDAPLAPEAEEEAPSLMRQGAELLLRGLMEEMQPALDEMDQALGEMGQALEKVGPALEGLGEEIGPKIRQLIALVDDFRNYDAPVMLPNGDILIRRNAPLIRPGEPVPGPNGEIEL